MEELLKLIAKTDITILLAILALGWYLNKHITQKIDKLEQKVDARFDKVEEKVTDIDRRMCRLEGAFSAKECYAIIPEKNLHKVE